eukprot:scaffold40689_cov23-Cyclotella_meneghiniana.AAC.1
MLLMTVLMTIGSTTSARVFAIVLNPTLYPAVIPTFTATDSLAPILEIDGNAPPYAIVVTADNVGDSSKSVTFTATAEDDCDSSPIISFSHDSGYDFPIGSTDVIVTATDNSRKSTSGTLTVTVIKKTEVPSSMPSDSPSYQPSSLPSNVPSDMPSFIPSSQPSSAPSQSPSAIPSSSPSIQPSSMILLVPIPDSNAQDTNSEEEDCTAEIISACGSQQRKLASSRELQASPWQIEYQVTETFTCEVAGCTSPADIAAVASIAETVSTTMGDSMESGSFLTLLSTNIVQTSGLDANIVNCLAVWGVTEEPVTEVGSPGTGRFYPDWDYHSGTCLEDGNEPIYMTNDTAFILDSLEECCERYYSWDTNSCNADVLNNVCVTDCESGKGSSCGGRADVFSDKLYANPRSCCESELAWRFVEFCEAESFKSECYGGTGLYYRGDSAGVD